LGAALRLDDVAGVRRGESLAMDAAGAFVATWSGGGAPDQDGVFARRVSAHDELQPGFLVNTYTTGGQRLSSVGMTPAGDFVIAWDDHYPLATNILAQRRDASGAPLGGEFVVNTQTADMRSGASAAMDAAGNFVIAWFAWAGDGSGTGVFGQRFDRTGARVGGEFLVNSYTTSDQFAPRVAMTETGRFVVIWTSFHQDGNYFGVFGQRFDAAGARQGAEFQVNTYTTGDEWRSAIAIDPVGNFTVAWERPVGFSINTNVSAQRFGGLLPTALSVDDTGNGLLEPGETVSVVPTWLNVNGTAQTVGGGLGSIGGPAGMTYAVTDPTASYGIVPDGGASACTDCYAVSVSNPSPRPATHIDATAIETITPAIQGQQKLWRLHVGDSFADVPRPNPFYRFVERLLHHGITGGCNATAYCPADATTREQMAVFVLVAKEGAGYAPPACTTPVFGDVPASNPFCRWIEELARRGVVSGCGGGNYCPTSAVTREQMAVFVLRTLDPALSPPACTTPIYNDVLAASGFCRWIEELTRRSVVTGCGGGNYCPTAPVTRDQMGVFISATFGLTLYGP
jgi:hypothetical protein